MDTRSLTLELLPQEFAVARMDRSETFPEWAKESKVVSYTRTEDELSVVCEAKMVPAGIKAQRGFRCFRIPGPLEFSEVGILASLADPLSRAGISIFTLSTYDTDYVFVSGANLSGALDTLREAGHRVLGGGE